MAATNPVQCLQDDASCSICLEYYKDPVTTECGHNFCRPCLTECWRGAGPRAPCPQCRELCNQGALRPNRHLVNMVDSVKQLCLQPVRAQEEQSLCEKHDEKLKVYCQEDEELICLVCSMSAEHRPHTVVPIEEAALEYKKTLQIRMKQLRNELKNVQEWTSENRRTASDVEKKCKSLEERFLTAFEELKQFLEQEKRRLLNSLKKDQEWKLKTIQGKVIELETQQNSLRRQITEMEEKCQQQDMELLKNVRSILSRYGSIQRCDNVTVHKLKNDSAEIDKSLQGFSVQHAYLQEMVKDLKETFPMELERRSLEPFRVRVTLDPDTAYPFMVLSENERRVRCTYTEQPWPEHPKRFTVSFAVLGREGFSSGRHYWEVQLLDEGGGWDVGVIRESVNRKEVVDESPEGGFWAVEQHSGEYKALTSPPSPLFPSQPLMKLGLYLDYEGGRLSFYNADIMEEIYTFTGATFTEQIYPIFGFWRGAELRLV